ncbi:unnamed protein product [Nesidiocoris tenuis]|uniref:Uncharacterized protein n=1 Tax=Nesidiocoris tenuis TaxID=355587 RepID=A0A6H5H243_9HEMI|nr:unnamed protein product [Nesidiocoris tenuis]
MDVSLEKFDNLVSIILTANYISDFLGKALPRRLKMLELYGNQLDDIVKLTQDPPLLLLYLGIGRNYLRNAPLLDPKLLQYEARLIDPSAKGAKEEEPILRGISPFGVEVEEQLKKANSAGGSKSNVIHAQPKIGHRKRTSTKASSRQSGGRRASHRASRKSMRRSSRKSMRRSSRKASSKGGRKSLARRKSVKGKKSKGRPSSKSGKQSKDNANWVCSFSEKNPITDISSETNLCPFTAVLVRKKACIDKSELHGSDELKSRSNLEYQLALSRPTPKLEKAEPDFRDRLSDRLHMANATMERQIIDDLS